MTNIVRNNILEPFPIGTDVRTERRVFLNYNDKLEHTLVLGTTGAGKLYNTIIPMIKHDVSNDLGIIIIEPSGEIAEATNSISILKDREAIYFNPIYENCPTFNPLYGEEETAIVNLTGAFKSALGHNRTAVMKVNLAVLTRCVKVVKRLYGNGATLNDIHNLLTNTDGKGIVMLHELMDKHFDNDSITQENTYNCEWFISYYKGEKIGGVDVQKYSLLLKYEITKLLNNKFLKNSLNPKRGTLPDIIFSDAIKENKIVVITTSKRHLRELETFLRYLFIYQLNSEITKSNKDKDTSNPSMIYLDEAQFLLNEDLAGIFNSCKMHGIGLNISTQSPQNNIKEMGSLVTSYIYKNCKNKLIYPYMDEGDYGELIDIVNKKDIVIARNKFRNIHYHIEKDFSTLAGVVEVDSPRFDEEYIEIEKIRNKYNLQNKTLLD